MQKMLKVSVHIDEIADAIGSGSPDIEYFLDTETGTILWTINETFEFDFDYRFDCFREEIESDNTGCFLYIPFVHSREGWLDMKNFIDLLPDDIPKNLKRRFHRTIKRKNPFRGFKIELYCSFPDLLEAWYSYQRFQNFLRAKILMEKHGIEVDGMNDERNWDIFDI